MRPQITLKIATSLDGKIALANGQSEWITCEKSREAGRRLRGTHDAIAIGANTAVLDNPQLTSRIEGLPDPVRLVFDSHLRMSVKSNLALTAQETPVWVFCAQAVYRTTPQNAADLEALGVKILPLNRDAGTLDVNAAMTILKSKGMNSLLLEGGGQLTASFLQNDLVDAIEWFRAPVILGGDGRNGIGDLNLENLGFAKRFCRVSVTELGDDLHETYMRQ